MRCGTAWNKGYDSILEEGDTTLVRARSVTTAACLLCGTPSGRIHSRYERHVSDLPCAGRLLRATRTSAALTLVEIDDWALRRNHRYGTIVCDLERRCVAALLPDGKIATTTAWLAEHSGIAAISRDRGGGYGEAATRVLPKAVQVADRWHLMENASDAFLDAVQRSMREIRKDVGATAVSPALLTSAERIQYEGYLSCKDTNAMVAALAEAGTPIKEIVPRTGHSRKIVRQIVSRLLKKSLASPA